MSDKRVILITGATGNCGGAAIKHLHEHKDVHIRAAVHDEKKAENLKKMKNVEVVVADAEKDLSEAFKGVDTVLIVPSQAKRVEVAKAYVEAAKAAKVKFIALLSITLADQKIMFGEQFGPVEKAIEETKIPYCHIRANFFMENYFGNAFTIKDHNAFYYPCKSGSKYSPISVDDIGIMISHVLLDTKKYANTTIYASGDEVISNDDLAGIYSKLLGRKVTFTEASDDGAREAMKNMGFPEWQCNGIIELWRQVEKEATKMSQAGDFVKVTGKKTKSVEDFLKGVIAMVPHTK